MQRTATFAEMLGLCPFYRFIRLLYTVSLLKKPSPNTVILGHSTEVEAYNMTSPLYDVIPHSRVYVVIHGGGFIYGSPSTVSFFSSLLASNTDGCPVLALKYPLAPEHPFPAPLISVIRSLKEIKRHYGGKVRVIGVSAGANLAIASALFFAQTKQHDIIDSLVLVGGPYTVKRDGWSRGRYEHGPKLTREMVEQYWSLYLPTQNDDNDGIDDVVVTTEADLYKVNPHQTHFVSPLNSPTFTTLPPTTLLVGCRDVLLSDTTRLATKMRNDGCGVEMRVLEGPHIHLAAQDVGSCEVIARVVTQAE
eukprot:sb/3467212/